MIAPNPFFVDRGFSVRVYEEARVLQQKGHQVRICTYHCGRNPPGTDVRRIQRTPWYGQERVGASGHKLYLDALLLGLVWRESLDFRPGIIHAHLHEGALVGEIIGRILRVPVVFDYQGGLVGELQEKGALPLTGLSVRFCHWLEKRIVLGADVVVVSATRMVRRLIEQYGLPQERIRVSTEGVDTDHFRPAARNTALKSVLGLPENSRVVVFLGTLAAYQGVDCLLQAVPLVVQACPEAHFLVMGYPNVDHYRRIAASLGVGKHVTFTGRIDYDRAAEYLALGDVAVSPKLSAYEANGKLYNYMACGLPTVAFDTEVSREVLGDTGIYARLGDVSSLADGLIQLLRDRDLATKLGAKARARVVRLFSLAAVAPRLEDCYALACRNRAHRMRSGSARRR